MAKAYVLLSGGVDSSTCLGHARKHFGSVMAVSILYGQRHSNEVKAAKAVAAYEGTGHRIVNITGIIGQGGLTDDSLEIPHVDYEALGHGVSPTFVPFRNGLMLSILASQASTDPEAEALYFGAHAEDAAGWAYPDCTPEFAGSFASAIYIGTYHKLRLYAPLLHLKKADVISLGESLQIPWHLTWSCYEGGDIHCGTCPTCRSRRNAFKDARVPDPTRYARTEAA